MNDLKQQGYSSDFTFRNDQLVEMETGKSYDAEQLVIIQEYRFEGITNPGDMSILYVIEASDGTKGTISAAYGANADVDLDQFLSKAQWEA
jgi:hypothetical protein